MIRNFGLLIAIFALLNTAQAPTVTDAPVVCQDKLTNCASFGKPVCQGIYKAWATDNCIQYCGLCPGINTTAPQTTSTPQCADKKSNCAEYGQYACQQPYLSWAQENCRKYCNFCSPTVTDAPVVCQDKLTNCASFGKPVCQGIYKAWATDNCIQYCGLCPGINTTAPQTTSTPQCADKKSNCAEYGQYACQQPYLSWAQENCRKYCNFCYVGWMLMLKGVSGVPGDLYQIWRNPSPVNQNVFQAMYLTSQFPGHYKANLANNWSQLCIDKVKVAIYKKGVEKANIVFNAVGANKDSWFDKSRIISSTYTDIQNAPKEFFSMIRNASTGREFYMIGQSSGQCDLYGWMMVATKNGCPFESSSGSKPAFLYAPSNTITRWSQTSPAKGDVFAILAHMDCSVSTTIPWECRLLAICVYKQNVYRQGQTWLDGCDYNCTCVNGNTGKYVCNNLCPVYNNLPPGCTLKKKQGECCSYPDCGNGIITNGTQMRLKLVRNFTGICVYKQKTYRQGDKWSDGCKYNCECTDGSVGKYVCREKCYKWNLPSVCTMDPPDDGYCCSTPNCPSYIPIIYPQGFVKQ